LYRNANYTNTAEKAPTTNVLNVREKQPGHERPSKEIVQPFIHHRKKSSCNHTDLRVYQLYTHKLLKTPTNLTDKTCSVAE